MEQPISRRTFIAGSATALGLSALSFHSLAQDQMTIQQVIDVILKEIPGAPFEKTVDTIKSSDANQPVTGIVSTMFATVDVIRKAIELKANFIIVHEPTFYNHLDETQWLERDAVFKYKKQLLEENKIVVWRFHDYWHTHNPDGIRMGVLAALDWKKYYDPLNPRMVIIPTLSLKDLVAVVKAKLGIQKVRYIGDVTQKCQRILLMPGASGGRSQIGAIAETQPDVIICGEVAEWETSEYIRDSRSMGTKRSLIVLGHAQSEEPGMQWLVQWLKPKVKGIQVTHIPANNPFAFA